MATILKSSGNDLKKQYRMHQLKALIGFIIFILGFGIMDGKVNTPIIFAIEVVIAFFISANYRKANIVKSGYKGEKVSNEVMNQLPDNYFVLPNLKISVDGKTSEMDHVIVGRNGIFVIETKHHKGVIEGTESDREFMQHKTGQKGGEYSKTFYSPIKQVNTHVYRLSRLLKSNGYKNWVQGAVVFTNPETSIKIKSTKTPVFCNSEDGSEAVIKYIKNYKSKSALSLNESKEIAEMIHKSRVN